MSFSIGWEHQVIDGISIVVVFVTVNVMYLLWTLFCKLDTNNVRELVELVSLFLLFVNIYTEPGIGLSDRGRAKVSSFSLILYAYVIKLNWFQH